MGWHKITFFYFKRRWSNLFDFTFTFPTEGDQFVKVAFDGQFEMSNRFGPVCSRR